VVDFELLGLLYAGVEVNRQIVFGLVCLVGLVAMILLWYRSSVFQMDHPVLK
jgi:hypothetical protein